MKCMEQMKEKDRWISELENAAGGGGSLLYTHFGQEMVSSLCSMGYDVNMWEVDAPEMGITGDGALVFEATKPSDQHRSRRRSSGTGCAGQC